MAEHLLEVLSLAVLTAALLSLALIDMRSFEVSPAAAIFACASLLVLLTSNGEPVAVHALFGAACAVTIRALTHIHPSRLGRGDAILFGIIGLAAGPEGTPLAATVCIASLAVTVVLFLSKRGKPFRAWRRHIYPAGPAAAVAATVSVMVVTTPSFGKLALAASLVALAALLHLRLRRHAATASSLFPVPR